MFNELDRECWVYIYMYVRNLFYLHSPVLTLRKCFSKLAKNSLFLRFPMALNFSFFIVLSAVASGYRSVSEASPLNEECKTETCHALAQSLKDAMNTSVDPCEDFFQYACGGWIEKHPIPADRGSYLAFEALRDSVSERITNSLRELDDETHTRAAHDAACLFKGCTNQDAREAQGLDPLRNIMSKIGGWPIAESEWCEADYVWYKRLPDIIREFSYTPLIGIGVDIDANKTSQHIIYIVQSSFGLGRNELVNPTSGRNEEITKAYKNYIISVAKLLNPEAEEEELERDAFYIMDFEQKLARFTTPPEAKRSSKTWYRKMTVEEVQRATENDVFQWKDFLNEVFRDFPEITDETEVIITDLNYTRNALNLARHTHPRLLANFLGWTVVSGLGPYTTEEFRNIKFLFDKVKSGVQKPSKLERTCVDLVGKLMGFAVGRLYVDNYFAEEEKEDVDELVEDVRSAYRLTIERNLWMDEGTKAKALDKLNAVVKLMGYPPWILNDNELNKYYETAKGVNPDRFFMSLIKVTKSRIDYVLAKWNRPTNKTHQWRTYPSVVNAFYDPSANTITFPAAILDTPYYDYNTLPPLNFGSLGGVIGHELSHGFDDQGSEYDSDGNLINWWTDETRDKFNEKADCFRKQYSSYVEPMTNLPLNGNNTVGENIADNGGLRNSYLAFKMHYLLEDTGRQGSNNILPGISATAEQLFFIGRALAYCGSNRKETLEMKIQYDTHTPSEFRVVVPLTNFEEFSEAFNCPRGSRMNPEHKCRLW